MLHQVVPTIFYNSGYCFNLKNIVLTICCNYIFWFMLCVFGYIGYKYALKDDKSRTGSKVWLSGVVHGVIQFICLILLIKLFPFISNWLSSFFYESPITTDCKYFFLFTWVFLIGGLLGSWIFGLYLLIVSYLWGLQPNDSFSAMKITGYKNFLRMHLNGNTLTIYPIGLKQVPTRDCWIRNRNFGKNKQNEPKFKPKNNHVLQPIFIESPITIKWDDIS